MGIVGCATVPAAVAPCKKGGSDSGHFSMVSMMMMVLILFGAAEKCPLSI